MVIRVKTSWINTTYLNAFVQHCNELSLELWVYPSVLKGQWTMIVCHCQMAETPLSHYYGLSSLPGIFGWPWLKGKTWNLSRLVPGFLFFTCLLKWSTMVVQAKDTLRSVRFSVAQDWCGNPNANQYVKIESSKQATFTKPKVTMIRASITWSLV